MYQFDYSISDQARELNLSVELIDRILRENLIPVRRVNNRLFTTEYGRRQLNEIVAQLDAGISLRNIVALSERR